MARNHYITEERSFAESACMNALKALNVEDETQLDALHSGDALALGENCLLSYLATLNFLGFIYAAWSEHDKSLARLQQAETVYAYAKLKVQSSVSSVG